MAEESLHIAVVRGDGIGVDVTDGVSLEGQGSLAVGRGERANQEVAAGRPAQGLVSVDIGTARGCYARRRREHGEERGGE